MMYLSKGVRVPSNDAGLFCVSHRGTTFPMGMQMSALWHNARNRPRPVPAGKEGAVLRLVEKGLAAITDVEKGLAAITDEEGDIGLGCVSTAY